MFENAQIVTYYDGIDGVQVVCVRDAPGEPFSRTPDTGDGVGWRETDFQEWEWVENVEVLKYFDVSNLPFTPGPWFEGSDFRSIVARFPTGCDDDMNVKSYGGHLVCESVYSQGNRDLIRAAPKMANLLKDIYNNVDFFGYRDLEEQVRDVLSEIGLDVYA